MERMKEVLRKEAPLSLCPLAVGPSSGLSTATAHPSLLETATRARGARGDTPKKNLAGQRGGIRSNVFPDVLNN